MTSILAPGNPASYRNVTQDILLAPGFITPAERKLLLAHYDACPLVQLDPSKSGNPTSTKYYKDVTMPHVYQVKATDPIDAPLLTLNTRLFSQVLLIEYSSLGIRGDEGFRLMGYPVGAEYKRHIDRSRNNSVVFQRDVSIIYQLNGEGDFEGGAIDFPRQNIQIALEAGDALIFPSTYTHPHAVQPITVGFRKSVVTWGHLA